MSNATFGHGGVVAWNSHTIGEVDTIGGVKVKADTIEATTHQSTDNFKEYILGLLDMDEVTIEGNYYAGDTDGQIAFLTDLYARTGRTVTITYPTVTGTAWSITALPTGFSTEPPINDKVRFTISFKPTGKPTMSIAAVTGMSAIGFSNDVLMMPTFAIGTYSYAVTITNGQTSTVITPVDATSGEVITITGPDGTSQTVATGVASSAITIAADALNVITIVISKTGYASKTYTFRCAVLAA